MRFCSLDIECTSLDASYGRILCVCMKFFDEDKVRTYIALRCKNEKPMLREVVRAYNECDVVVTWNGKLFDIRYINARLMQHNLPPLDHGKMHKDLMWEAKKLRLRGARLDGVSKDLRTKVAKYDVPAWRWILAAEGDKASSREIVTHCELDVLLTEEMMERLKPLIIRITR